MEIEKHPLHSGMLNMETSTHYRCQPKMINHRLDENVLSMFCHLVCPNNWKYSKRFLLICNLSFQVGIGNVWRFPYLAYQNGGGAFLFPYIILLIFVGKPMYYMEAAIGQFARVSPLQLWECAPIAKGVGFAMVVVSLIVSIYYNVIMSYAIIYMGASFVGTTSPLPWTSCSKFHYCL